MTGSPRRASSSPEVRRNHRLKAREDGAGLKGRFASTTPGPGGIQVRLKPYPGLLLLGGSELAELDSGVEFSLETRNERLLEFSGFRYRAEQFLQPRRGYVRGRMGPDPQVLDQMLFVSDQDRAVLQEGTGVPPLGAAHELPPGDRDLARKRVPEAGPHGRPRSRT